MAQIILHQTPVDELTNIISEKLASRFDSLLEKKIDTLSRAHLENKQRRLSRGEFCRRAEISRNTSYAWERKGLIKPDRTGGGWSILEGDVLHLLKNDGKRT